MTRRSYYDDRIARDEEPPNPNRGWWKDVLLVVWVFVAVKVIRFLWIFGKAQGWW